VFVVDSADLGRLEEAKLAYGFTYMIKIINKCNN
jgi:hypothetical protein